MIGKYRKVSFCSLVLADIVTPTKTNVGIAIISNIAVNIV